MEFRMMIAWIKVSLKWIGSVLSVIFALLGVKQLMRGATDEDGDGVIEIEEACRHISGGVICIIVAMLTIYWQWADIDLLKGFLRNLIDQAQLAFLYVWMAISTYVFFSNIKGVGIILPFLLLCQGLCTFVFAFCQDYT